MIYNGNVSTLPANSFQQQYLSPSSFSETHSAHVSEVLYASMHIAKLSSDTHIDFLLKSAQSESFDLSSCGGVITDSAILPITSPSTAGIGRELRFSWLHGIVVYHRPEMRHSTCEPNILHGVSGLFSSLKCFSFFSTRHFVHYCDADVLRLASSAHGDGANEQASCTYIFEES